MMRVGLGYDVHPLVPGRPCIIGGVTIPHSTGLQGHSDGDVLLHAICDALLGAVGAGDLGRHFPSDDPQWKGISSLILLETVSKKLSSEGYRCINCDCTVIAESPKISPYTMEMQKKIAAAICMRPEDVNIKGTTNDKLGFIGKGEGIAAQVVCLLHAERDSDVRVQYD